MSIDKEIAKSNVRKANNRIMEVWRNNKQLIHELEDTSREISMTMSGLVKEIALPPLMNKIDNDNFTEKDEEKIYLLEVKAEMLEQYSQEALTKLEDIREKLSHYLHTVNCDLIKNSRMA